MAELFDNLLELQWRGIPFPFEHLENDGSQSLAKHLRADRDGARSEGTGRNPYVFQGRIPLINGLARGPQETWSNLFPQTFDSLRQAMEDRSTGKLQHPIFGDITCKPVTWKFALNADTRGGVIFDATWEETNDDADAAAVTSLSQIAEAKDAATTLDDQLTQLGFTDPGLLFTPSGGSFGDFIDSITSIGDQAQLFKAQVFGKIDNVIGKVNKLADSIDSTAQMIVNIPGDVGTTTRALGNSAARIVEACNRMNFALIGLKATLQIKSQPIGFFVTQADATLGGLASQLSNSVADVVSLNPLLLGVPVIPPSTPVRYYTSGGLSVQTPFGA